jgi:multiple sugar transport system substrate-binding protein
MHKGQLLDLSKYLKGTIDVSDFDQGQLAQGKVDGKLYAVSIGGNMPGLMYNKTLIEKAGMQPPKDGISWDDFASYAAELAKKLPKGVWPIDDASGGGVGDAFEVWTRQRHPESYTKDGKIAFTETDVQEWFAYWGALRKKNLITPGNVVAAEIQNGAADAAPIVQGKAVFCFAWSNFLGQYQILTKDQIGVMRYPTGGKQAGDYVQASQFFSISSKSKAPDSAAQFIQFFVQNAAALKILGVERGVPASAKARDLVKPTLKPYDALQVQFLSQAGSQTRPKTQLDPANSAAVGDALQRAAQSIPLAHASINVAAKKFMSDAEKALVS